MGPFSTLSEISLEMGLLHSILVGIYVEYSILCMYNSDGNELYQMNKRKGIVTFVHDTFSLNTTP